MKKLYKTDVFAAVLLIAAILFLNAGLYKTDGLMQSDIVSEGIYMALQDSDGSTYVIDQGHTRILKLDAGKRVVYSVRGNSKEKDTISYASDMAVGSGGDIYVEENHWGGLYIDREAILVYDSEGNYKATCYDVLYDKEYVDKRKVFGMVTDETYLYFAVLGENKIAVYRMSQEDYEMSEVRSYDYENAFNAVYDINIDPDTLEIMLLDKRGSVTVLADDKEELVYASSEDASYAGKAAFYAMTTDHDKNIYLADIKGNAVYRIEREKGTLQQVLKGEHVLNVDLCEDVRGETILTTVYDDQVYQTNVSGEVLYGGGSVFEKAARLKIQDGLLAAAFAVLAAAGIWILVRGILLLGGTKLSDITRNGLLLSAVVIIVVAIVVMQLMSSFRSVYTEELFDKLYISARAVSSQLTEEVIADVNAPEDFMNDAYNELVNTMETVIDRDYEFNQNIYCNILKYENGEAFSIAYLDQSTGTYYPLDEVETQEVIRVYETGQDMRNDAKADISGSFAYVKVPVFNSANEVIAVVAVGSDTSIIGSQIVEMQNTVLITLATIIVILLFLFGEALGYFNQRSLYKKALLSGRKSEGVPLHIVRLVIFITFIAFNMATSFLPVYAARLVSSSIGIPQELAASLPLTLNLAFMGIMSMFCAPLMARFRFKNIVAVSAGICFAGDITIFLNSHYYALLGGLVLNGIGVGVITNCINMFIASSKDAELKRDGFTIFNSGSTSGINVGSMVGASLAGALGQQQVFAVSAAAWLLTAVLFLVFGKNIFNAADSRESAEEKREDRIGFGRFVLAPSVWGYMLCVQIPYIMLNSFIFYYVPLYGAENGLSENVVGLLMMVNSLCSVYLGVSLTNFFDKHFGRLTVYISTAMSLGALILFAASPSIRMLVITLLIMGISSSFGFSAKSVYFTELPKVTAYGEEESMGVYNLSDNVGESAGPMIFGRLMSSGNLLSAMLKFTGTIFAAGAVYAVGSRRKGKQNGGGNGGKER